jgi:hypothetical protein
VLGLLGYAIGASAMALAQGLSAVIVFWAVLGGIGASLLLPATVLPPADQQRVAQALEENAQFMNTQLAQLLVNQPPEIRDEIIASIRNPDRSPFRCHCSFPSSPS